MPIVMMGPDGRPVPPDQRGRSTVGWAFDRYMGKHCPWQPDEMMPTNRHSGRMWTGRTLRVKLPSDHGTEKWAAATVLELDQSNMGPFSSTTSWRIKLQFREATHATALGGADGVAKYELLRCDVESGGTLSRADGLPLLSFEWTAPPSPPSPPPTPSLKIPDVPELDEREARMAAAEARFAHVGRLGEGRDEDYQAVYDELCALLPDQPDGQVSDASLRDYLEALMTWPTRDCASGARCCTLSMAMMSG